jgi:ankyrin repeat protein
MIRHRISGMAKGLLIVGILSCLGGCDAQDQGLIWAAGFGHPGAVKLLLESGADINARNNDGETPLMVASLLGHVDIVKLLLAKGADVDAMHKRGMTALMRASFEGHVEVVRVLVDHGADVNVEGMIPALSLACEMGRTKVVKLLLEKGADVNAKDHWGNTALVLASKKGHGQIVELLKAHGAK